MLRNTFIVWLLITFVFVTLFVLFLLPQPTLVAPETLLAPTIFSFPYLLYLLYTTITFGWGRGCIVLLLTWCFLLLFHAPAPYVLHINVLSISVFTVWQLIVLLTGKVIRDRHLTDVKQIKSRDVFTATAAHELKTPLTSIKLYAELMQRNTPASPAGRIVEEAEKMLTMINTLLVYSKFSHANYAVKPKPFDLQQVIAKRIETLHLQFPKRTIQFQTSLPKTPIYSDSTAVDEVVTNLLTNAIRYTEQPITFILTQNATYYFMQIKDGGEGLPEKLQKVLWTAFSNDSVQGLGLGLYIVKQLITALHGKITFQTSAEGTSFLVKLPKRYAP